MAHMKLQYWKSIRVSSSSTEILIGEKIGNKIVFNAYDYDSSSIGEANGNILKSQAGVSAALLNTSKEQVESKKHCNHI